MSQDNDITSAELEREVAAQRLKVESRIDELKDRLSPGQLLDEALNYAKGGGGAFASNLGQTVANNPLPATLLGVSLAWLMLGQNKPHEPQAASTPHLREPDYPYARISSPQVRRVGHSADPQGEWWSEFEAGEGQRYRARSNQKGDRLGHFADDTGKLFSGFIDDAGHRVSRFQDESGNMLHEAAGWASHTWRDIRHGVQDGLSGAADSVAHAADDMAHSARDMGRAMQKSSDQLTRQIGTLFEQQPLVAGALAFAAGAALGAALPHTREEDQLVGKASDELRREAGHMAADAYEQGKTRVGDAYQELTDTAGEAYAGAKERVAQMGEDVEDAESAPMTTRPDAEAGTSTNPAASPYRH